MTYDYLKIFQVVVDIFYRIKHTFSKKNLEFFGF